MTVNSYGVTYIGLSYFKMETWLKVSLILALFGLLKEIRPSEPFVYEYLTGNWTQLSENDVSKRIFPVGTYASLALLVVSFLITDICRYKPLIIVSGVLGIAIWALLIWMPTLLVMQLMEVLYGAFMATDVAYYTYMYAKVEKCYYDRVTSNTRVAYLLGRAASGVISQLLVSFHVMDFKDLNYITFAAMILATTSSLFLPSVKTTVYFHREDALELRFSEKFYRAMNLMKVHFIESYSNGKVIKWSILGALATAGFVQVQNYIQTIWSAIADKDQELYNGATEAGYTIIGALGSFLAGYLRIDWSSKRIIGMFLYFVVSGALLIWTSKTGSIFVSYGVYIAFGAIYHIVYTIISAEIAKEIVRDSYGLIFGINSFISLVLQTILTTIVVKTITIAVRNQYLVYGILHLVISVIYVSLELLEYLLPKKKTPLVRENPKSETKFIT